MSPFPLQINEGMLLRKPTERGGVRGRGMKKVEGEWKSPADRFREKHEARGEKSMSARERGSLEKLRRDGRVEAGKSEGSEDLTTIGKCVCAFCLLQWPHLPLHPVKEA